MAGDTRITGVPICHCDKIFRIRETLIGVCGGNAYTTKFIEWFRKESPPDSLLDLDSDDDEKSFLALALDSRGLWLYTNLCEPDKLHDGYYAIGTGAQAACESMRRGDTPAQAVKAAMRWDECTGGKVTELHLTQHGKTISKKAKKATPVKGEAKPGNTGRVEPSVEDHKENHDAKS